MQTFLPYMDFDQAAKVLDYRRLGKQRVETFQILAALRDPKNGWANHPAVRMWEGCEEALKMYMNAMIREWVKRGYSNNMSIVKVAKNVIMPVWLGDELLHSSHRAALLAKDPVHYNQFGWTEKPEIAYYWPLAIKLPESFPDL